MPLGAHAAIQVSCTCDKRSAKQDSGVSGLALSREGCRNRVAVRARVLPAPTLPNNAAGLFARITDKSHAAHTIRANAHQFHINFTRFSQALTRSTPFSAIFTRQFPLLPKIAPSSHRPHTIVASVTVTGLFPKNRDQVPACPIVIKAMTPC